MLIEYVEDKNNQAGLWKGYVFAVAMFLTGIVQSFFLQYYFHMSRSLEMKIKTSLVGVIYEKVNFTWDVYYFILPSRVDHCVNNAIH